MTKMGGNIRRVPVSIYSREYLVRTDETVQHINELAHSLDKKMRRIAGGNANIMEVKVAVLAALTILDEHVKLQAKYEELLAYVTAPADEAPGEEPPENQRTISEYE